MNKLKSFTQESLRIIKKASEDNKLVIVVGAGVSMLSNLPSWKEIIDRFSGPFSEQKEQYSQNEYLRIPQKYYNLRGHKEYYDLLREIFDLDLKSNKVHDEILKLNPIHLITTNYDDLLEQAIDARGLFYDVIAKDEEVSQTRTKNFLIKMHGDVKHQNVVLKENDYLSYSHQFRLVETMVKSVIASNITLFIGYSLNDRNMKLILNWVKELQGSSFQPVYLLYLEETLDHNNFDYYKSQGIHVIDIHHLVSDNYQMTYEQRYLTFFHALAKLNLDELYQSTKESDSLRQRLAPLQELNRVRLKDLRHLLKEEITEIGTLKLSKSYELDQKTCQQLKKAGIRMITLQDESTFYLQKDDKNYLMPPYTSILTTCMKQREGIWQNYDRAYYQYKHGNLVVAYDLYKKTAADAFKSKHYLLYFLAQFNRYWTGRTIERLLTGEEVASITDEVCQLNLELMYYHLPATFKRKYAFLSDLSNFYFIYKYQNQMIELINQLQNQEPVLDQLNFKAQELFEFMYENLLVIDEYLEVSHLYKSYIEARFYQLEPELDSFTLYLIIKYMSRDELKHLIARIRKHRFKTEYVDELVSYYEQLLSVLAHPPLSSLMQTQLEKMVDTFLTLLSIIELKEEQLLKILKLLITYTSTDTAMNDIQLILQEQLAYLPSNSLVMNFLQEQLSRYFIKKYLLNELISSAYVKLAQFIHQPIDSLQSIIKLKLEEIDSFDLIELMNVMDEALKVDATHLIFEHLVKEFDFDLFTQAIKFKISLPYHTFEERLNAYLKKYVGDLSLVCEWVACDIFSSTILEGVPVEDERNYFLLHYECLQETPVTLTWFWELPVIIHQRLKKTSHRMKAQEELIKKIKDGDANEMMINLYFDVYYEL